MNPDVISALAPVGQDAAAGFASTGAPVGGVQFGKLVSEGLSAVNQQLKASEAGLQQLATGNIENLHQVMIQLEEARLSMQLLMQVRSRLLEAYQEVMRMQI